ncbi:MAG: hypothetical protein S0880_16540 [Actinomycetota bacterium]|nr:hypothetical protein [Actinomycetota bacterium]
MTGSNGARSDAGPVFSVPADAPSAPTVDVRSGADDGRLDAELAAQIAAGLASSTDLERVEPPAPGAATIRPVRLIGTPSYDVWVTGWSPGQRGRLVDLTAPGGTVALAVADGALIELADDGRLDRGRRLAKGAVVALEALGDTDDLDGRAAGAELVNGGQAAATTVHVCSPPRQLSIGHQPN